MDILLGTLANPSSQRDAIHVAVVPVTATETCYPGQRLVLQEPPDKVGVTVDEKGVGIVDPYLLSPVYPGQRFWMLLYPNTITGLRHHWEHPAFDSEQNTATKSESEEWLRGFAKKIGFSYESMLAHVDDFLEGGDPYVEEGTSEARDLYYDHENAFWDHYERVTGRGPEDSDEPPFSCSC